MKLSSPLFFSFVLIGVLCVVLFWLFIPLFEGSNVFATVSPLPSFLSRTANDQVSTTSLFLPDLSNAFLGKNAPDVPANSAIIFDTTLQKTLFEKNPKEKLPMASLAKIMTAIIAIENAKPDDKYIVKPEHLVGENSMGLSTGEVLSLEELMYGLILPSGNDAAEVLAAYFPGGRTAFISAMNNKAKALGLSDTHFTNPSGLEGDGNQYSTTYDLMVMTQYALTRFPLFAQVVKTYEHKIEKTNLHKGYYLFNETNLLTSYPGVKGVKTGYTFEAGLCLVTYLEYKDHKIIGVLLGSNNRRQEMKDMLDYSLLSLGIPPPKHD